MKTTYLIWKEPPFHRENPDWLEISGKAFLELVRSSAGKNRHFIKLSSTDSDGADGAIVMETTKADYLDWKREKNHADYLKKCGKDVTILSYNALDSDDGEISGEELLEDRNSDADIKYFEAHKLEIALASLTCEERQLIEYLYISDNRGTIRSYGDLAGMSKSTVSRHHRDVLEKLNIFSKADGTNTVFIQQWNSERTNYSHCSLKNTGIAGHTRNIGYCNHRVERHDRL